MLMNALTEAITVTLMPNAQIQMRVLYVRAIPATVVTESIVKVKKISSVYHC